MPVPNWIEHAGAGRRELDDPEAVVDGEVGVEPPPEAAVELLRAVDVRDGDDDDLELHVDRGSRGGHVSCPSLAIGALVTATLLGGGRG